MGSNVFWFWAGSPDLASLVQAPLDSGAQDRIHSKASFLLRCGWGIVSKEACQDLNDTISVSKEILYGAVSCETPQGWVRATTPLSHGRTSTGPGMELA